MIKSKLSFLEYLAVSTLWTRSFPSWAQYLFLFISNIQCFAIFFSSRYEYLAKPEPGTIMNSLEDVFNKIALRNTFDLNQTHIIITLILITLLYFLLISFVFLLLVTYFLLQKKPSNRLILFMNIFSQFHLGFGFWFTTMILTEAINYDTTLASSIFLANTWTSVLYFVLISLSSMVGIFLALFSYNPFINSGGLSAHSINFQFITFLIKISLVVIIISDGFFANGKSWLLFGTSFVLLILRHYELIRVFSYYEYYAMKVSIFLSSICLLNSTTNFLALCLEKYISLSAKEISFVDLSMTPFIIIYWRNYFQKLMPLYLNLKNERIKSEELALKKLFFMRYLLKNAKITSNNEQSSDIFELYFFGFFSNSEKSNESNKKVPRQKYNNYSGIADLQSTFSGFGRKKTIDLLQNFIKVSKFNEKARIILTCLFLDNIENLPTSTFYLGTLSQSKGLNKIVFRKLHGELQENIKSLLTGKEGKSLNIQDYIDLECISTKLIQMIHSNSQNFVNFWKTYNGAKLEVKDLYKRSKEIENINDLIQNYWIKTIEKNPTFASSLSAVYSIYLSLVRNSPASAQRILEKSHIFCSQKNESKETGNNITAENINSAITLHVSMSRERLGKIIYASSNILEALGWQKQNLLGQNINEILPRFLQEQHDQLLLAHLINIMNGSNLHNLQRTIESFVKDKANHIVPCQVYLSLHPFIQSELTYVGLIKIKRSKEDIIILDKDGQIEGYSRSIGLELKLVPERRIHIKEICNNHNFIEKLLEQNQRSALIDDNSPQQNNKGNSLSQNLTDNIVLQFKNSATNLRESKKVFLNYLVQFNYRKIGRLNFSVLQLWLSGKKEDFKQLNGINSRTRETNIDIPDERLASENVTLISPVFSKTCSQIIFPIDNIQAKEKSPVLEPNLWKKDPLNSGKAANQNEENSDSSRQVSLHSQEIRNKILAGNVFQNFDTFDTSSVSGAQRYKTQMEHAIKMIPKDPLLRTFRMALILYLFTPLFTSILFQIKNSQTLDKIEGNIDIISQSTFRLAKITELSRLSRYLVLADTGLMYSGRFTSFFGTSISLKEAMAKSIKQYGTDLNILNNKIRDSLYKIESNLQEMLYVDKVPVFELDNMGNQQIARFDNPFDLVSEFMAAANRIAITPVNQLNYNNSDINFLLNNTLNHILVSGERINPILLEDSKVKLQNQQYLIAFFLIIKGCLGIVILTILHKIIKSFIQSRNQLVNILLCLGKDNIEKQVHIVGKFISFLEKNNMDSKRINLKLEPDQFMSHQVNPLSENSKLKRKTADFRGVNSILNKLITSVIAFLALVFSITIVLIVISGIQKTTISNKISVMAESDLILYKFKLFRSIIFEYVEKQGTTIVRNKPISEELNDLFSELTRAQDFFAINLLDQEYGIGDDREMVQVVKGSLCDIIPLDAVITKLCRNLAAGTLEKGLIGLNSYVLAMLYNVRSTFDSSRKTYLDKFKAINSADTIVMDVMEFFFTYQAFELIDNLIRTRIKQDLRNFNASMKDVIAIYVVICILLGIIAWQKITTKLGQEFSSWRKLLRLIPYGMLIHNKQVKTYLIKNGNGFLTKFH